jgi:hypothetical protein
LADPEYDINPSELIGKLILVGLRFYDSDKNLLEEYQTHGVGVSVEDGLLSIRKDDLDLFYIPFSPIKRAKPGSYKERSTGIVLENPDFLCSWKIDDIQDKNRINEIKEVGFKNWVQDQES